MQSNDITFQPFPDLPRLLNLAGQTFTRWTVLGYAGRSKGIHRWYCQCVCGNVKITPSGRLRNGNSKSCGCITRKHGQYQTPEYHSWENMRQRCNNPRATEYFRCGARGVTVCKQWDSFEVFLADMGPKPTPQHTLDRYPNQRGNYEPSNVRWATKKEQANNMTTNVLLTFKGKTRSPSEWATALGIDKHLIYHRHWRGLPIEQVLHQGHLPRHRLR